MVAKEIAKFFRQQEVAVVGRMRLGEDGVYFEGRMPKVFDALWGAGLGSILRKAWEAGVSEIEVREKGEYLEIRAYPNGEKVRMKW